ncbi:MAG: DUF924 family protein [Gammaproteobacteria bacterium]
MTTESVAILDFWFADCAENPEKAQTRGSFWFAADPNVDVEIRRRFAQPMKDATSDMLELWKAEPRSCLALVLLLDQFPRNACRGTAQAFAHDGQALSVAEHAVAANYLDELTPIEQAFALIPFQHSESLSIQRRGIELFIALEYRGPREWRPLIGIYLGYARKHLVIIERFGRFPHRNVILGRKSTSGETAYLKNGPTFGQSPTMG